MGVREIVRRLGRSRSTRLPGAAAQRGHAWRQLNYPASTAQWKAELVARRPKSPKLVANERLREYVQDRLVGEIRCPNGTPVVRPQASRWKGRNKPRRQDRRWAMSWSPEQISNRLKADFPDEVGRPQLAPIQRAEEAPRSSPLAVLYAPTWESWEPEPGVTSSTDAGELIIKARLSAPVEVRVLYKPHPTPRTGTS